MADKQSSGSNSNLPEDIWLVRPCEVYKDEYRDCKSLWTRLYQHYTDGIQQDCTQWLTNFNNCMAFRNTKDFLAAEALIAVERERRNHRLKLARMNDVWEYRTKPPAEWLEPLS
ncbi:unnamed protein product [Lymnaea stagnalis]|uniref:Synaptic plasticity regulator PANTS n=1 Tax=Lymnaea stagnalis TaxID=6523 RepID=A0AAV2I9W1_LYMST